MLSEAMKPAGWTPLQGEVRVTMQREVTTQGSTGCAGGRPGATAQAMSWILRPGDEIQLHMVMERRSGKERASGTEGRKVTEEGVDFNNEGSRVTEPKKMTKGDGSDQHKGKGKGN